MTSLTNLRTFAEEFANAAKLLTGADEVTALTRMRQIRLAIVRWLLGNPLNALDGPAIEALSQIFAIARDSGLKYLEREAEEDDLFYHCQRLFSPYRDDAQAPSGIAAAL